jgi:P-type Ca2+ transporter type 2C
VVTLEAEPNRRPMALLEPTNLLLLACAVIYAWIGELGEAAILLLFVGGICLLDASQQQRSRRALAELARLATPRVRLRRAGEELTLPPSAVQLGDLLRLEEGDRLAADARLTETVGLWLDESLLTGESCPVQRQNLGERVLAGSLVASGHGWAEVVAVGPQTELGRLSESLVRVRAPLTRLQRHTRRLTGRLTVLALALCAVLLVVHGTLSGRWVEALLAALALALAVLPNEIPVVLALFLALGALRLGRIGVLARWPAAVESLGSTTVLAVDKTGTLTENRMAAVQLLTWPEQALWRQGEPLGESWHRLLELAVLASRNDPIDAMEVAIQRLAASQLQQSEHLHPDWPLLRDYPLSRELLVFSQLWCTAAGRWQVAAKGAPEAVVQLCHLDPQAGAALLQAADGLARSGLRVLAVASGLEGAPLHEGNNPEAPRLPPADVHAFAFEPIGLIGLADPLRPEVPAAIARARAAGVRVVMITGDSPVTARSIADQAGLPPGPVISGPDLEQLSPSELASRVDRSAVFARIMPQQKLQLVQALQAAGEVVAMGGDGVNDAPALKAADIGVAMGKHGSAVAREAADLVLLRDDLSSLVEALALGRRISANLQRALGYTLAIHLPIAALTLGALLRPGQPLLLLPVHIAVLHLVIDPACTVVLEALPAAPDLMQQPPRPSGAPLLSGLTWRRAVTQGGLLSVLVLALGFWPGLHLEERRSLVLLALLLAGGGLVWLNGDRRSAVSKAGALLGVELWLLIQLVPGLPTLMRLAPLPAVWSPPLAALAVTLLALLAMVWWRPWPGAASSP